MAEETNPILNQSTEDGDRVVTMSEILENEQEMLDDANAVLGAMDDKNCTYAEVSHTNPML